MKPAVLVLASTYPRWRDDVEPGFVHELSRRLLDQYEVHVLAPHFEGASPEEEMDGVHVHRFRYYYPGSKALVYEGGMLTNVRRHPVLLLSLPFFGLALLRAAVKLARQHRVALVHAHWVIPQGVAAWIMRVFCPGVPLLVTSHGADVYGLRGRLAWWLKRRVYGACAAVTVVSNAMADELRRHVPGIDVRVAPMGVDLRELFVPRTALAGRRGLVFVGRLVEKKGVDVLLEAFAQARQSDPSLQLRIVGQGPYLQALQQLATSLGIGADVEFVGAVPNAQVPELLSRHAIAVVPSVVAEGGDQEGLGLVAVEAMGCGCAVLASDLPALRDVVQQGQNGLLFPPGDSAALAVLIGRLASNEEERCELAQRGRESALQRFDWAIAAERYRTLYAELLSPEPPNRTG